jgi:hypothetical protein
MTDYEAAFRNMTDKWHESVRHYEDRIEKLEAALHQWDDLIVQQFTGSRSAMSDMVDAAQITAALLHGDAPWPEPRIEKLEAALREIAYGPHDVDASYAILFGTITTKAIKALEGKDD